MNHSENPTYNQYELNGISGGAISLHAAAIFCNTSSTKLKSTKTRNLSMASLIKEG
jgi:hypothetical protein